VNEEVLKHRCNYPFIRTLHQDQCDPSCLLVFLIDTNRSFAVLCLFATLLENFAIFSLLSQNFLSAMCVALTAISLQARLLENTLGIQYLKA
jgi:hypothetical protein